MDPQERLFLEEVYHALEDAGYTRSALADKHARDGLKGQVGVFAGVMYEEYQLYGAQAQMIGENVALSGNPASVANRVSYFCDFHGPSLTVDTMCSSSLTAIHLACRACAVASAGRRLQAESTSRSIPTSTWRWARVSLRRRTGGA